MAYKKLNALTAAVITALTLGLVGCGEPPRILRRPIGLS